MIFCIWKDRQHWQVTFQVLLGPEIIRFEYHSPPSQTHLEDTSPLGQWSEHIVNNNLKASGGGRDKVGEIHPMVVEPV